MLQGYLDESYNADFFTIGAALADESSWEVVADEFDAIIDKAHALYGVRLDAELHGHELMGGSGDWKPLRGAHSRIFYIYLDAQKNA